MRYTIDRIEGNLVVLLQKGNESIRKEVPVNLFPPEIKDGDLVEQLKIGNRLQYKILVEETTEQRNRAEELLNKLKNKH